MPQEDVRKIVGKVFNELADGIESGTFGRKMRVGLTTLGSEHGPSELYRAAKMAKSKYNDFDIVLIGPKMGEEFENHEASTPEDGYSIMESLLDSGKLDSAVTMHYNFPIGVSTVGRVITPGRGREMAIATTTGASSASRVEAMFKNAVYGIIAAKAFGCQNPSLGILNVDGARQVERALRELSSNGYGINFAESIRSDKGAIMRGNDLLSGTPDVMVTDTLTGNILVKMFSSYTTGGNFESSGYGYGPGIGENYNRIICIISRASGAPVIAEALHLGAVLSKNNLPYISRREFNLANKAGYNEILKKLSSPSGTAETQQEVTKPPKKVVTYPIAGIDILELENAVRELWKNNIYSESGMGCTGPIVLVSEDDGKKSEEILAKSGYLSCS